MRSHHYASLFIAGLVAFSGVASAENPSAEVVVKMAVDAAESDSTMDNHNMIRIAVHQEETLSDGTTKTSETTAIVHGGHEYDGREIAPLDELHRDVQLPGHLAGLAHVDRPLVAAVVSVVAGGSSLSTTSSPMSKLVSSEATKKNTMLAEMNRRKGGT